MNNEFSIAAGKTPKNWQQVLQKHATLRQHGRSYIVLTSLGNLEAVDQVPRGAKELQFQVVAAIVSKFINSQNIDHALKQNLTNQLNSLAEHTFSASFSQSFNVARSISELTQASQSLGAQRSASQISSTQSSSPIVVANQIYEELNLTTILINNQLTVVRSTSGRDGTYFCTALGVKVPLKFVVKPQRHIFADRLFQAMGFKTPNTRLVSDDFVTNEIKIKILTKSSGSPSLEQASRPLVQMDYLTALAWENMRPLKKREALNNSQFGIQIGKMLLLDVIIGNNDRIPRGSQLNAGNFMVEFTGSDCTLVLCDNEIRLDIDNDLSEQAKSQSLRERSEELRELLSENRNLSAYLIDSGFATRDAISQDFEEKVKQGILEGADEFLELCSDHESLNKIFNTNGLPEHLTRFNYVNALIKVKEVLETHRRVQ